MTSLTKKGRSLAIALVALTVTLAGCGAILNDPAVWSGAEDEGGAPDGGVDATTSDGMGAVGEGGAQDAPSSDADANVPEDSGGVCTPSTTMCATGSSYLVCSSGGQWEDASVSCEAGICLNGVCLGSCSLGQTACENDRTIIACSAAGSYDGGLTVCDASACVNGACTGTCSPGETRCTTAPVTFQSCTTTGAWNSATTCAVPTKGTAACALDAGCSASCSNASYPDYCSSATTCVNWKTDTNNCGFCGHTCGLGVACGNGYCPPATVCTTGADPTSMTLMSGIPFVTNGSTLYECNAGNVTTFTDPTGNLESIQANVTNGSILGMTATSGCNKYGVCLTTYALTLESGGVFSNITPGDDAGTWEVFAFAVDPDEGNVFYGYSTGIRFVNASSGGLPTAAEPPNVCVTIPGGGVPGEVAADLSNDNGEEWVSWFDSTPNTVSSAKVSGTTCGAPVTNATVSANTTSLVTDGMYVAWEDGSGAVYTCGVATTCGSSPTLVATGQGAMGNLVFDQAHNLYWIGGSGLVTCAATGCGGAPAVLEPPSLVSSIDPIGDDGQYVYWVDYNSGTLYRVWN